VNRVQRSIIKKLLSAPKLRYAQIKPKNVEGNLFTYHLRKLITEGLIDKSKEGLYGLTAQGKLFVDRLSMKTLSPRIQPKIVTMMVIKNDKDEYIVYKRKREPFIKHIGFPHGKIHLGESVYDASHRELTEKVGFDTELSHRGEVYATVFENSELVTHILCHIFSGAVRKQLIKGTDRSADCYWAKITDPHDAKYLPAFGDIFELCQGSKRQFFKEFTYNL
jgi:ADP-ribose pyrophosphatase YjhB (NUDIX family)